MLNICISRYHLRKVFLHGNKLPYGIITNKINNTLSIDKKTISTYLKSSFFHYSNSKCQIKNKYCFFQTTFTLTLNSVSTYKLLKTTNNLVSSLKLKNFEMIENLYTTFGFILTLVNIYYRVSHKYLHSCIYIYLSYLNLTWIPLLLFILVAVKQIFNIYLQNIEKVVFSSYLFLFIYFNFFLLNITRIFIILEFITTFLVLLFLQSKIQKPVFLKYITTNFLTVLVLLGYSLLTKKYHLYPITIIIFFKLGFLIGPYLNVFMYEQLPFHKTMLYHYTILILILLLVFCFLTKTTFNVNYSEFFTLTQFVTITSFFLLKNYTNFQLFFSSQILLLNFLFTLN